MKASDQKFYRCTCTATGQLVPLSSGVDDNSAVNLTGIYPSDGNAAARNVCDWPCNVAGICVCDYPDEFTCDLDRSFTDLDSLLSASGGYEDYCNQLYVLDFLSSNMTAVLAEYNGNISTGYQGYFDDYVDYVKAEVPGSIQLFMEANGTEFFSCTWDNGNTGCPKWSSLPSDSYINDITVTWHLDDSDGFYATLSAVYGVNSSWVMLGTSSEEVTPPDCPREECQAGPRYTWTFNNYPVAVPKEDMTVYNPASVFTSAGAGCKSLSFSSIFI